jgi:hypothetical protein
MYRKNPNDHEEGRTEGGEQPCPDSGYHGRECYGGKKNDVLGQICPDLTDQRLAAAESQHNRGQPGGPAGRLPQEPSAGV